MGSNVAAPVPAAQRTVERAGGGERRQGDHHARQRARASPTNAVCKNEHGARKQHRHR